MPEMTDEHRKAMFRYRSDPSFGAIIDTLVDNAVHRHDPNLRVKMTAAHDLFVLGCAMVVDPFLSDPPNVSPFDFAIREDGNAEFIGKAKSFFDGPAPSLAPGQFVFLSMKGEMPPAPRYREGEIIGCAPWLAAWKDAEENLDEFLAR